MNARLKAMTALATLGLALAAPAHAAPDFPGGLLILAKKDGYDDRDTRRDERSDERRNLTRDEDDGQYGTGYERRQQKRDDRKESEDDRHRFRR